MESAGFQFFSLKTIYTKEMFRPDENGHYSESEVEKYADYVNNTMMFNFTDQSTLGPCKGSVKVPRLTKGQAYSELNQNKNQAPALPNPAQGKAEAGE